MDILGQVAAGIILLIVGWFGNLVYRRLTGATDPPTAAEIARAQLELARDRDARMHVAASELYDIVGVIRSHSATCVDNLVKEHIPEEGFEAVAMSVRHRWEKAEPTLNVLERDDIPLQAGTLVDKFVTSVEGLATELMSVRAERQNPDAKLVRAIRGVPPRELRELAGPLIGLKYEAETLQSKIDPYRRRFHPKAE